MDISNNPPKFQLGQSLQSFKTSDEAHKFAREHKGNEIVLEDTNHDFHVFEINKADGTAIKGEDFAQKYSLKDIANIKDAKMGIENAHIDFVGDLGPFGQLSGYVPNVIKVDGGQADIRETKDELFAVGVMKDVLAGKPISAKDTERYNEFFKRPGADLPTISEMEKFKTSPKLPEYQKNLEGIHHQLIEKMKTIAE